MRILITNIQLSSATGTEIVCRDLAIELQRRDHEVAIYSPLLGRPAAELSSIGIEVVGSLDDVPFEPDVVHGHHHSPTIDAIGHFARTPAIWVCHDRLQYEDIPPIHPAVVSYVAVDLNCRERLVDEAGIAPDRVSVVHNAVDLDRYPWLAHPPSPARRALVFSNQARPGGYLDAIVTACAARGMTVDVIGAGVGATLTSPEAVLGGYDVVFAKARCALEAIVSGCAVVLVDHPGFGGLVTTATVAAQRDWNFGARCLQGDTTAESVGHAIDMIDPTDVAHVTAWTRSVASITDALSRFEDLYTTAIAQGVAPPQGRSPLQSALAYAGHLERRIRAGGPAVGHPLPPGVNHALRIRILRAPLSGSPGAEIPIEVELANDSHEVLASVMPYPVHIGHRWHQLDGDRIIEGARTVLPTPLYPGAVVTLRVQLQAPDTTGDWQLKVTLVQELVAWHDQLEPPLVAIAGFSVRDRSAVDSPLGHTLGQLLAVTADIRSSAATLVRDGRLSTLSFADDLVPGALTFAAAAPYLARALAGGAGAVITTEALAPQVPAELALVVADAPDRVFFELHNALGRHTDFYGDRPPTEVHSTATVHPTAIIDRAGVTIGEGTVIGPGVIVLGPARIGAHVIIDASAIIGTEAFQTSGRAGAYLELHHTGGVEIGDHTHVHAGSRIAGGPLSVPTSIGARCQIGVGAFVSHQCRLGHHVFVGHHATVNGRVVVGDAAWIGPGAIVSNRLVLGEGCSVALGSVVIHDIPAGAKVSGLPALDQHTMFRHAVTLRRGRR